ncbi:glycogen/starch synthase, ADP-glucose type [Clostridium thermobutyricum]|uniref:Glycogen synthase n=1 Tax=Clostridium thermobutyricum TaxID=29372 RepID=N9WKD3_9CLOT|nr:glycogen synthase GlgA [Clostridium thermobutyricum]ENZ03561.1 glycogen/starch synthase, ADP-glucose type [Clostridium thermobutyricum]
MKILFSATEAYPFIRTGGLGDVIGALSKELSKLGEDVRVIIPKYKGIKEDLKNKINYIKHIFVDVGWRHQYCGIEELKVNNVQFYFIDNEYYFNRDNLYGYYDDAERFAFYDRAVLEILKAINWYPDIIHCNDWQCGMIPVLYKLEYRNKDEYPDIKFIYSIHNLLFQGNFGKEVLGELFGYDLQQFNNGCLSFNDGISYMKGGINYSEKVLTVSYTYAEEIKTPEYGECMDELLRNKGGDLKGILNGIDYEEYNPLTDELIEKRYDINSIESKMENKLALQRELGLEENKNIPIISIVSRLTSQKGIDLIKEIIDCVLTKEVQFIVLGTGEWDYEEFFKGLEKRYPNKVATRIIFDNKLSHKIYAGSDMFLMPSKFEPCGLGQLIALRYGNVPIVRETGGLKDTIEAYNKFEFTGNGFSFYNYSSIELKNCIFEALEIYKRKDEWNNLVKTAMSCDNSWKKSALEYKRIYESFF